MLQSLLCLDKYNKNILDYKYHFQPTSVFFTQQFAPHVQKQPLFPSSWKIKSLKQFSLTAVRLPHVNNIVQCTYL